MSNSPTLHDTSTISLLDEAQKAAIFLSALFICGVLRRQQIFSPINDELLEVIRDHGWSDVTKEQVEDLVTRLRAVHMLSWYKVNGDKDADTAYSFGHISKYPHLISEARKGW